VCLSVREDISGTTSAIFTKFLVHGTYVVARSSSGMLTIGHMVGSAPRGRSVVYDCFVQVLDFVVAILDLGSSMSTRMWANAQRDGRPAEHRWRRLFNAAKFG